MECKSDVLEIAELIEEQNIHDLVIDANISPDRYIGRFLTKMTQLHSLIITNRLTTPVVESLVELLRHPCTTQLTTLQLTDNNLIQEECNKILNTCAEHCKSLEKLSLDNNEVNIDALNNLLAQSPSIETLRLKWNSLRENEFVELSKGLVSCYSLKRLFIEENQIGSKGAIALFSSLAESNCIEHVYLRKTDIPPECASEIGKQLMRCKSLETLSLPSNILGASGITQIGDALLQRNLTELDLSGNKIGPDGAAVIANMLPKNQNLLRLNLRNNEIKDLGAEKIALGLKENDTLQYLSLSTNFIGDTGARAIVQSLLTNNSIESIDLNANRITENCAGYFEDLGKVSTTLHNVGLSYNFLGESSSRINMIFEIKDLLCKLFFSDLFFFSFLSLLQHINHIFR